MNEEMNGQETYSQQSADGQTGYSYGNDQSAGQGYTGQSGYTVNNTPQPEKPAGGIGFGIASLVLGIISLLTFCTFCLNVPLAILAIIFGVIQLVRGQGKGMAIAGLVTAVISIVAMIALYIVVGFSMPSNISDWDSYMKQYENQLDNNDYNYQDDYSEGDDTF